MREFELAAVVCARICHDLANPVGAIVNGTELIQEIRSGSADRELALVDQSAQRAAAVLQLHRLAFGAPRDPETELSRQHVQQRIEAVLSGPRITLTWNALEGCAISPAQARLATLMVLAGRAMLGLGGELKILIPKEVFLPFSVMADGPRAIATEQQRDWLRGDMTVLPGPRHIEFALVPPAAAMVGARLEVVEETDKLALRAVPV